MAPTLTHIWLLVDDVPRSVRFYRDTLGLKLTSDLGQYAEFCVNDQYCLALFQRTAMQQGVPMIALSPTSGQRANLAFEVESVDATRKDLVAKGLTFASEIADHAEWGLRTFFLTDPDGNLLCLYCGITAQSDAAE